MTADVPVFDLELTPAARRAGVTYLHDVYLEAGQEFASGDRIQLRDEGGDLWDAEVVDREDTSRGLGHKYRLRIQPTVVAAEESVSASRDLLRRRATWLTQLGLSGDVPVPVEAIKGVACGALALLAQVERLERERAEARAWAWANHHGVLEYAWVSVAGNEYSGDADELPAWLTTSVSSDAQEWWPTQIAGSLA